MPRKTSAGSTRRLSRDRSGQTDLFEKSLEEEQEEREARKVECLGMTFDSEETRREYFLERLREKLEDPEFKKTPGFPKGSDEAILRMSDPPWYTACPNPFLAEFVRHHGKPYDPEEEYRKDPFSADVSAGKNDPVYTAHSYHTKPVMPVPQYASKINAPGSV